MTDKEEPQTESVAPVEEPPAKIAKLDHTAGETAMPAAEDTGVTTEQKPEENGGPVQQLGYKKFEEGIQAFHYFNKILVNVTKEQDLNEYEFKALLDLLSKGHPTSDKKIGAGVRAIQVRTNHEMQSDCFYVLRVDGTIDDFSYRKCLLNVFPGVELPQSLDKSKGKRFSGGRGRGGRGRGRFR